MRQVASALSGLNNEQGRATTQDDLTCSHRLAKRGLALLTVAISCELCAVPCEFERI